MNTIRIEAEASENERKQRAMHIPHITLRSLLEPVKWIVDYGKMKPGCREATSNLPVASCLLQQESNHLESEKHVKWTIKKN